MSDLDLARLAARFVALCEAGVRSPRQHLADEVGASSAWVRDRLRAARERHLLTKVGQGETGGALTATAVEVLEAMDGSET